MEPIIPPNRTISHLSVSGSKADRLLEMKDLYCRTIPSRLPSKVFFERVVIMQSVISGLISSTNTLVHVSLPHLRLRVDCKILKVLVKVVI
jgi:hypothetical protein